MREDLSENVLYFELCQDLGIFYKTMLKKLREMIIRRRKLLLFFSIFVIVFIILYLYKGWLNVELLQHIANYFGLSLSILFVILLTPVLLLIIWIIPKWYVKPLDNKALGESQSEFDREKEKRKLEDDTRKTLAQIIGGVFLLFGIFVTYNTYRLNVDQQNLTREGQITDRFSKAVEHLGSNEQSIRIGGLYALERIARDSSKDQYTVFQIISAFISVRSPRTKDNTEKPLPLDVVVGLYILTDEKNRFHKETQFSIQEIVLTNSNLRGATFIGANFRKMDFSDSDLRNARLWEANLELSDFINANLSGANFTRSLLEGSSFRYANLTNANFEDSIFSSDEGNSERYGSIDLRGADLTGVKFSEKQLESIVIDKNTKIPKELENRKNKLIEQSEQILIDLETEGLGW